MNQVQIQQATHDEALGPTTDRVKINITNMKIDLTLTQKEETYQVILDIIKTSLCYNAFLITADGQLSKLTSMFVDHMHQLWRILATIINKCLSVKTSSNDRLRESRVGILFTKIIINYFLSQHKSISKRPGSHVITIKDDGVLGRLKFIAKGEETQIYSLPILDMILNEEIKNFEAYISYVGLSTSLIPPKKGRCKGGKRKVAQIITPKKKGLITADDYIIPEPDVAFELGKSISKTEAKIIEEAMRVHETYERLVTKKPTSLKESNGEPANRPTGRRKPTCVIFKDTLNVLKKKSLDQSQKLKGIQIMTDKKQLPANTKKAIKANKQATRIQHQSTGSSKGAGITLEVLDEPKDISVAKLDAEADWGLESKIDESNEHDKTPTLLAQSLFTPCQSSPKAELYNALLNLIMLEEAIAQGDVNPDIIIKKRDRGDDQDPTTGSDQGKKKRRKGNGVEPSKKSSTSKEYSKGKTPPKPSKTGKSVTAEESVVEHVPEATMDMEEPTQDDEEHNANQPEDKAAPTQDSLTFDELMATPIDFSKFSMNCLKIDKITKVNLVAPVCNLLKWTCKSSFKLKYNMDQCFNALTNKLDWTNPEGDKCPYDVSKPLPLKGSPGHITVPADYFFNDDLITTGNSRKKYTVSIIKTKATKYDLKFIEDMISSL
nr:hypothetical protein [Tanacetum cinerariifolium]